MNRKMRNVEEVYELSPLQQGLLFHFLRDGSAGAYFLQSGHLMPGLNVQAFQRAWQRLVDRHPVLRTSFHWDGLEKPVQVVHRLVAVPFTVEDWRSLTPPEVQQRLVAYRSEDRQRGFTLTEAPLLRVALFRLNDQDYHFDWSWHHISLDGWSGPLVLKELFAFYQAFRRGQELDLPAPRPYRDYIAWLRRQDLAQAEAFWRRYLRGFTAPTPLPLTRPGSVLGRTEEQRLDVPAEVAVSLRNLARRGQFTLNTLFQGAWALLLGRYTGQQEVVFGAVFSGRPPGLPGVESMVGLFINTLPVRVSLPSGQEVQAWLKELQAQLAELTRYEHSPLFQVQLWSEVPRATPLFEIAYVFENYPADRPAASQPGDRRPNVSHHDLNQTHFPLSLLVAPQADRLRLILNHAPQRIRPDEASRLLCHLSNILTSIAARPEQRLAEVALMSPDEERQVLVEWNATRADFPRQQRAFDLFEAQVAKQPEAPALVYEGQCWSYAELNARANRLAHHLRDLGVGPETLVGICAERCPEMVVALLAVLKSGGAFVPLDPYYPPERLAFMLEDSTPAVLLTQEALVSRLPKQSCRVVCLDAAMEGMGQGSQDNSPAEAGPENLAYVIYTSGSTGRPKGAQLSHAGLCNLARAQQGIFRLGPGSRVLQFSALSFDAAVWEVAMSLLSGGTLVLAPRERMLPGQELLHLLKEQQITTITLPPSALAVLPPAELPHLGTIVCAGEACPAELVARWGVGRSFFNAYGPTEVTVCATIQECSARETASPAAPPIGKPLANVRAYVLDDQRRPTPVGVPGELWIGGAGLARGYHGRPALTAERFVPDPFAQEPGARLYRTGDLACWLPGGQLEYLGRLDHQVKVRGYRIELGEIEAALAGHPGVRQAVVTAREDDRGPKRLVGYVVAGAPPEPTSGELRAWLQRSLPDYMVPSAFVLLPALPLTPNGKVDRKALPAPDESRPELESEFAGARTPTEEVMAGIWADLLKLDRVGVRDNFFDLGGHSLLATRVVSRIRETLKVELPLRTLFEAPTVAALAEQVETLRRRQAGQEAPPLVPVGRDRSLPLSFAQQRLWFIDQLSPGTALYIVPGRVRLSGPLDLAALKQALADLVCRHEVLRTTFPAREGQPVQVIAPPGPVDLPVVDLRGLPPPARQAEVRRLAAELARPFDLVAGPLLRLKLLHLGPQEQLLQFTMHHTITDGWSQDIFSRELTALYRAGRAGQPTPLPTLTVQYADYAVWQRTWLQGEALQRQLDYWKKQLHNVSPLELSTDRPRPPVQRFRGSRLTFRVPADLTTQLRALSRQQGATVFMTLLAAFQTLLARSSGQNDVAVGTAIAGRTHEALEGLIGFFVNTLVLRTDLSGDPTFLELLGRVREVCLGAYAHQDLPFDKLVEELKPPRDPSRNPLFQVNFGMHDLPLGAGGRAAAPSNPMSEVAASGQGADRSGPTHSPAGNGTSLFDLGLQCLESPDGLLGLLSYSTDLFEAESVARLARHYQVLLGGIAANPKLRLSAFTLLSEEETAELASLSRSRPMSVAPLGAEQDDPLLEQLDHLSDEELDSLLKQTLAERGDSHE